MVQEIGALKHTNLKKGGIVMDKTNKFQAEFQSMNFGTVVTTSEYHDVEVVVDPEFMMKDYATAVVHDLERRNPVRFASVSRQAEEFFGRPFEAVVSDYLTDLAKIRIQSVRDECKVWREAKQLAMPPYVQFAISMIGTVLDYDHGRRFVPYMESTDLALSTEQLFKVTELLRAFEGDGVVLLYDAFPKSKTGDQETMSYAIIDGYVKSIDKNSNPAKSYIAVFLGMKLQQESELKYLYSVRYDDIHYVKDRLIMELTKW